MKGGKEITSARHSDGRVQRAEEIAPPLVSIPPSTRLSRPRYSMWRPRPLVAHVDPAFRGRPTAYVVLELAAVPRAEHVVSVALVHLVADLDQVPRFENVALTDEFFPIFDVVPHLSNVAWEKKGEVTDNRRLTGMPRKEPSDAGEAHHVLYP